MTRQKAANRLDFEALRFGIERPNPDLLLGFHADSAHLSIVNVEGQRSITFELRRKAEIARHLRVAFGQETSHRVERQLIGGDRVTFRESCDYPDGGRVVVETTLEVSDGKIVRQVDVVANERPGIARESVAGRPPVNPTSAERTSASLLRSMTSTKRGSCMSIYENGSSKK